MEVSKQDWKLFRAKLPEWQENYMDKLNKEYTEILNSDKLPSEKFWELEKRIKHDKRCKGVLISLNKRDVPIDLVSLINDGVIGFEDIKDFSSELQETVRFLVER